MILPERPDRHHPHRPVACLACERARRTAAIDWPPAWRRPHRDLWTWAEAERSCWAPDWQPVRVLLGWPS